MNEQMQLLVEMLNRSQWQSSQEILQKQLKHFNALLEHAKSSVPYYQQEYGQYQTLQDCPILTRDKIQKYGDHFISTNIPEIHGQQFVDTTSGSTGKPVKVIATDFTRLFYDALMLREHDWHQRNFTKQLVSIRWAKRGFADAPIGHSQSSWGPPINQYKETGPSVFMNVASKTADQIEGLRYYQPAYVMSYPSQLTALAEYCLNHKITMPFIEEVRTTGESFGAHYYTTIKSAWPQVKVTDTYSSVEMGNIAQQCPLTGQYHINAEHVLVEIVDDHDQPCCINQPGRVIVTNLLNYATPFIRYEIGDYAELGEDCPCGRGLPVIRKIHGRKRNRLRLPTGESLFPYLGEYSESRHLTQQVKKFQFVQHTLDEIEIKLVLDRQLTPEQEKEYIAIRQKTLGYPFNIKVTYTDHIPLGPSGKYEEFVSLVG